MQLLDSVSNRNNGKKMTQQPSLNLVIEGLLFLVWLQENKEECKSSLLFRILVSIKKYEKLLLSSDPAFDFKPLICLNPSSSSSM